MRERSNSTVLKELVGQVMVSGDTRVLKDAAAMAASDPELQRMITSLATAITQKLSKLDSDLAMRTKSALTTAPAASNQPTKPGSRGG